MKMPTLITIFCVLHKIYICFDIPACENNLNYLALKVEFLFVFYYLFLDFVFSFL